MLGAGCWVQDEVWVTPLLPGQPAPSLPCNLQHQSPLRLHHRIPHLISVITYIVIHIANNYLHPFNSSADPHSIANIVHAKSPRPLRSTFAPSSFGNDINTQIRAHFATWQQAVTSDHTTLPAAEGTSMRLHKLQPREFTLHPICNVFGTITMFLTNNASRAQCPSTCKQRIQPDRRMADIWSPQIVAAN
jgi:hypothetical protein